MIFNDLFFPLKSTIFFFSFQSQATQHEEDFDRLVDAAFDVAKTMQELMSVSVTIMWTPGAPPAETRSQTVGVVFPFFFLGFFLFSFSTPGLFACIDHRA